MRSSTLREKATLARALWDAGLAPQGTTRLEHADGPTFYQKNGARWEPWRSWDAVAHLLLSYRISIVFRESPGGRPLPTKLAADTQDCELVSCPDDIPAGIARLALRLRQDEEGVD